MTPFELVNAINKEISTYTPKLSAAINKALLYYGDGSALIGVGYGKNENDEISFEESESITVKTDESPMVMLKVMQAADLMESHSRMEADCGCEARRQGRPHGAAVYADSEQGPVLMDNRAPASSQMPEVLPLPRKPFLKIKTIISFDICAHGNLY